MMINKIQKLLGNNSSLIRVLEKITGSKILVKLPLGIDPILDIQYNVSKIEINTISDVGSNIGQSENYYFKMLPKSTIYCFEPVYETFNELKKNIKSPKTKSFNFALGEEKEMLKMRISKQHKYSDSNSLNCLETTDENYDLQEVKIETLSSFCTKNEIERINLLKIDTEGYDLKVLRGGENLLSNHKIDFIQVEVSMNPFNTFHVSFDEIKKYLESFNYYIFSIYDQIHDFKIKEPILRRTNVMYISQTCLNNIPTTKPKLH